MELSELRDRGEIPVACGGCGWDNKGRLILVDRYITDYPPIPRISVDSFIEFYIDEGGDPDDRIIQCPACDDDIRREQVVERLS